MRKFLLLLALALIFISATNVTVARAEKKDESVNLESEVENLIDNLDLSELEKYLKELPEEISKDEGIKSRLIKMLKGETDIDFFFIEYDFSKVRIF